MIVYLSGVEGQGSGFRRMGRGWLIAVLFYMSRFSEGGMYASV